MIGWEGPPRWTLHIFDGRSPVPEGEYERLAELASVLPRPYLLGYQAWTWHEQGKVNSQGRGQYVGSRLTADPDGDRMAIVLSARALQEFLAGRVTRDQFANATFGDLNPFELALKDGSSIQRVSLERGGVDRDDDFVVFEYARDPSSSPLSISMADTTRDEAAVETTFIARRSTSRGLSLARLWRRLLTILRR